MSDITTLDSYIGAAKQLIMYNKATRTTTAAKGWWTVRDAAGQPGAATLPNANNSTGTQLDSANTGACVINAYTGGATGRLSLVSFGNTVAARMMLYDILWSRAISSTTSVQSNTITNPPSYNGRMPGGNDFVGTQLWIEVTTAFTTTSPVITITYTNSAGTAGRSTGAVTMPAVADCLIGRMIQLPLQAGDVGVQKVESIAVSTTSAAGACNVQVIRQLWTGRVQSIGGGDTHGLDKTGLPYVAANSCIALAVAADSTASGVPDVLFEIVNA